MHVIEAQSAGPRSSRSSERAFSIVEVIVAVVVLAVVVLGATSMFATSTRTTTVARVRDKQSSAANDMLARLQSDSSWATWCKSKVPASNPTAQCPIQQWVNSQPMFSQLSTVRDGAGNTYKFNVTVVAEGVDLPADGKYPNDADGTVPDLYRLTVTFTPDSALKSRFPNLTTRSIRQEVNPSNRVVTGRVLISGCVVTNQVDERLAAGDCAGSSYEQALLPPSNFDANRPVSSCQTPGSTGGENRDCLAYKCANPKIASKVAGECRANGAWTSSSPDQDFVSMYVKPATGSVRLRSKKTGRWYGPYGLSAGTVTVRDLPVGRYDISMNVTNGSNRLWKSKSVPSSGEVAIEAGLKSRAVLVFRPAAKATVRIKIKAVDSTIPWFPVNYDGYAEIDKYRNLISGGIDTVSLVPVPKGRLLASEIATIQVRQTISTKEFVFRNVEPGLYSFELGEPSYTYFKHVSKTSGFIYVYPDGRVYYGTGAVPEWVNGMCAETVRAGIVGSTYTDPVTGYTWPPAKPCKSPGGSPGAGGSGGGGFS